MAVSYNSGNFNLEIVRHELQDLIQGNDGKKPEDVIQAAARYLGRSKTASTETKTGEYTKEQETADLIGYINSYNLWYRGIVDEHSKIGEGAEQKVYFEPDTGTVIKLNDSIYFSFWQDYFHNLLLHNYFFPAIAYTLLGFLQRENVLFAVVRQAYVRSTDNIDLNDVKEFLVQNGFENTRNNDYCNRQLGIILEDLHDENVISADGALFFIDTVFYIMPGFYGR